MTGYNGWTAKERDASTPIQAEAILRGIIRLPAECEICTCPGRPGMHLEDYSDPLDDIRALCIECHMRLHARFKMPNRWIRHVMNVRTLQSRQYKNIGHYFSETRHEWARDLNPEPDFVPDPLKWWENLPMRQIDLTAGPDRSTYWPSLVAGFTRGRYRVA